MLWEGPEDIAPLGARRHGEPLPDPHRAAELVKAMQARTWSL